MIIAAPDSSPLTPRKWEQHQTLVLANSCDIGSLSSGFLNWPRPSGTGPLSSSQTLPYWKAIRHRWVLRHRRPKPLCRNAYQTLTRLQPAQSRLVLIRTAVLLIISSFAQGSAGVPLTSGTSSAGRRHLMHCPCRSLGCVLCLEEYREGTNHRQPSQAHRIPPDPTGNGRRQLWL